MHKIVRGSLQCSPDPLAVGEGGEGEEGRLDPPLNKISVTAIVGRSHRTMWWGSFGAVHDKVSKNEGCGCTTKATCTPELHYNTDFEVHSEIVLQQNGVIIRVLYTGCIVSRSQASTVL